MTIFTARLWYGQNPFRTTQQNTWCFFSFFSFSFSSVHTNNRYSFKRGFISGCDMDFPTIHSMGMSQNQTSRKPRVLVLGSIYQGSFFGLPPMCPVFAFPIKKSPLASQQPFRYFAVSRGKDKIRCRRRAMRQGEQLEAPR